MSVSLGMILEARERLKGVAQRTGLVQFKALSDENTQVYLKTEDLQNTGSFKVRGAYIKIASSQFPRLPTQYTDMSDSSARRPTNALR